MDYIITIARFLGAFVLFALFPITVQLIFYTIDKLIFKKTYRPKIYNICIVLNTLICGGLSAWLCFCEEYDNGFTFLVACVFAAVCVIVILCMIMYNIRQHNKLKNNDTQKAV
ncbi:hypothetical protein [Ruminococcus sp.]|uniref:hypothetical protein n=1 Tax=Ruminococcus sp. TaxID=41978 RepID=UPI0025FA519E|nr:hypothetical protein [Ruminococcus sp.]